MELAEAEILTALATISRRFGKEMKLHDTIRERDLDVFYDYFAPMATKDDDRLEVIIERLLHHGRPQNAFWVKHMALFVQNKISKPSGPTT